MFDTKIKQIIKDALKEDIGRKDITTYFTITFSAEGEGVIIVKEKGVLCGIEVAAAVFKEIDRKTIFIPLKKDGDIVNKQDQIARIKGNVRAILTSERVALNFLSLLSGIATSTALFVDKVKGTKVKILDTRKTTPNLRIFEKYAVRIGGGHNHRSSLETGIIVKDNHLRAGNFFINGKIDEDKFKKLINHLRNGVSLKIEIEVEKLSEFHSCIKYEPDVIMLDNFSLKMLKRAVDFRNKYFPKILIEASGGINLKNVRTIAVYGVDFISIGSITHSSKAIDFSLEIIS